MSNIPNLASLARLRLGSGGGSTVRRKAFGFDGVNDYISSPTIGRTGYDMNVSGNVTTGSDGDGDYIQFNGSYRRDLTTGSIAKIGGTSYAISQAGSFSCSCIFKVSSFAIDNNTSGLFGINSVCSVYMTNNAGGAAFRIRNGASFADVNMSTLSIGTLYKCHLVYDASVTKVYCYVNGVLQNSGGTSVGFSFSGSGRSLGDDGVGGGNHTSCNKYIYHACIRNKALSQAEIDADIALGNTTKQDPSIVAYYVPENLQYNTQYMSYPTDLSDSNWNKGSGTVVTSNTSTAPDGTTTADNVTWTGTNTTVSALYQNNTSITGSTIASKTFIVKAFCRTTAGTQLFRLNMTHPNVAAYFSSNQSATTTRQEFTFTQTFTSSTSGTGVQGGITCPTTNIAGSLEVRNVRVYLTNETLRDESPNIGGFIGRKTQKVLSCRVKPNIDAVNTTDAQMLMLAPRALLHIRNTLNTVRIRNDTRLRANEPTYNLGTGFRDKVHILGVQLITGGLFQLKLFVNGVMVSSTSHLDAPNANYSNVLWAGRRGSTYYSGNERDIREYTFTGSFADADALAIYNGGEPTSAGVTKYLHYRPPVGEVGTTTQDQSPNDRDGTLNGGVTRDYI